MCACFALIFVVTSSSFAFFYPYVLPLGLPGLCLEGNFDVLEQWEIQKFFPFFLRLIIAEETASW